MPPRNISIILLAVIFSVICYAHALRNHYAGLMSEAMHIIEKEHLEPVADRKLFVSAMNGMMSTLDEHSMFMTDTDYRQMNESIDQEFGGVGIQVSFDEEQHFVIIEFAFPGSPAFDAGLQSGDLITSVDGEPTAGLKTGDVVKMMKGSVGAPVVIGIRRPIAVDDPDQESEFEVTVVRQQIELPSVKGDTWNDQAGTWNFVLEDHPRIGYIRLDQFGRKSGDEVRAILKDLNGNVDGLILDLRFNLGGSLDVAIDICDMFIDSGTIVSTRGRNKLIQAEAVASAGTVLPKDLPMTVLINEASASASEIVSACLQDHGRAVIVGERSYGKGTVQNLIELEQGRSLLKLTTASFWRPSERNIHRLSDATEEDDWGVIPNEGYRIKIEQEEMLKVLKYRRARDLKNRPGGEQRNKDAEPVDDRQLLKAIEYLQTQVSLPQAA